MKQLSLLLFILFSQGFLAQAMAQQAQQLTFRVDMRQQTVSSKGVHVAGSFQSEAGFGADWNPGSTPLSDADGDGIWETTVQVPQGQYQYKFINGNSWSEQAELPPANCSVDDGAGNFNRELSIGASTLRLPVVAFGSCNPQLLLSVNMKDETVAPEGVYVAGNFQALAGYESDWSPAATPLRDPDGDKIYEIRLSLPTGGLFQYKYLNGSSWAGAEQLPAACSIDDGAGNRNRTVNATAEFTSAPAFCFSTCENCGEATYTPPTAYDTYWWNDAVFYEIFVRSFYDSNGDGKGDFKGLTQKLDYLNDGDPATTTDLGITGIWLMPMMESPSYHGYDVTNYRAVEPDYGSMADFEAFLAAAHERGIKVIIDFVMNHTSDQHPWFTQSASSTNAYRDWYRWSGTRPGYKGPWGQEVWHPRNGAYYYGLFWSGMPDLNWSNPAVQEEMWDITRFWLEKGVDGYRLDAIKYLDEDASQLENTSETFALLEEFNEVYKTANPDALTVGEVWSNTASVIPYVTGNKLDIAFEFDLATAILGGVRSSNPNPIRYQLNIVANAYAPLQFATFLTNHDQNRVIEELEGNMAHMKQAAALYLSMPGVPFLYYGEEIGMLGTKPDEDIRRPMQWTGGSKAGFTSGTPWHSLNPNYAQFNVQSMASDPASLLNHYKKLIRIRNQQEVLRRGYYLPATSPNPDLLSYARVYEEEAVVVVSNFNNSSTAATPTVSFAQSTLPAGTYPVTELYSQQAMGTATVHEDGSISNWSINASLGPDQTWLLLLSHKPQEPETPTGLEVQHSSSALQLYPNPSNGALQILLPHAQPTKNQLQVYDLRGKLLYTTSFSGPAHTLSTKSWANGTYLIRVETQTTVYTKQVVVVQ